MQTILHNIFIGGVTVKSIGWPTILTLIPTAAFQSNPAIGHKLLLVITALDFYQVDGGVDDRYSINGNLSALSPWSRWN